MPRHRAPNRPPRPAWVVAHPTRGPYGPYGPRVYHLDPDCGSRKLRELAEITEREARKVARLCLTCRRAFARK